MIVLEITDETGVTHYEILNLAQEDLSSLDDKAITAQVRNAAKKLRSSYQKAAQRGDEEAEEILARVNKAETVLKQAKDRESYHKELESGKGATLEVLRVQRIAPAFFWDRNVRFRTLERLMREAGLATPLPVDFDA